MNLIDIAKALDLEVIGDVATLGKWKTYQSIEIKNRLGRAWMVLVTYGSFRDDQISLLPDLHFLSYGLSDGSDIIIRHGRFLTLMNITDLDSIVMRFKAQSQDWDLRYIRSLIL
jgi:hypothetical protein